MKAIASNTELGTLNVIKYDYETSESKTLWTLSYGQGASWFEGKFSYTDSQSHAILFEGVKGLNLGDIALDDISFFPSSNCSIISSPEINTTPTSTSTQITNTYSWQSQSAYDCNFENGYCNWKNDTTSDFNWSIAKGFSNYYYGINND